MQKFEINDSSLNLKTLLIYPTGTCGTSGPYILANYQHGYKIFRRHESAKFFNDVTGRTPLLSRSISQDIESQISTKLSDVLVLKNDRYVYIGPGARYSGDIVLSGESLQLVAKLNVNDFWNEEKKFRHADFDNSLISVDNNIANPNMISIVEINSFDADSDGWLDIFNVKDEKFEDEDRVFEESI